MKVVLVNGSPNEKGCTYRALEEIEKVLNSEGIDTEIFYLGKKAISGCIGCGACLKTGECFMDDIVNTFLDKAKDADGFIFGSAVHYASATGFLIPFMDRVFYGKARIFKNKPAACVVSCRRGGATATFDQINKYFAYSNMPIVTSQYWNMVHGRCYEDVEKDLEGLQTMRSLAKNMSWMLKCIEAGDKAGVDRPKYEKIVLTDFIR